MVFISTPIIRPAPAIFAPIIADKPIPPKPNIATVSPGFTLAVLVTAPMPVVTPQPSKQISSSDASLFTLASEISGNTVYSENVDVPM